MNLSPSHINQLLAARTFHTYHRQEELFHEGGSADAIYCIRSGEVNLLRSGRNGEQIFMGARTPGDLIGIRALLSQTPYLFTAKVFVRSLVCSIPGDVVMDLANGSAPFALELARHLAMHYQQSEEQLFLRTQQGVTERTARLLTTLLRNNDRHSEQDTVSMCREDMCVMVGTTPETLSLTLDELARRQIIAIKGRSIVVIDPEALERADRASLQG